MSTIMSSMSSFRKASDSDRRNIQKLFKAVAQSVANPALFNWPETMIEQEINLSSFYISEGYSKNIEAFIAYRSAGDGVEILALGTDPQQSRQGLMRELLTRFVQLFSKNNVEVYLEVHALNAKAIGLYHQVGFKTQRTRKAYYQDGNDALIMHYKPG